MSSIRVNWRNANSALNNYASHRQELSNIIASVRAIKSYRCMTGRNFAGVYQALDRVITRLENEKKGIQNLENGLSSVLKTYDTCENGVAGNIKANELEEKTAENPFSIGLEDIMDLVSNIGIIGKAISVIGGVIGGGWTAETIISSLDGIISIVGDVAGVAGGTKTDWLEALTGLNDGLKGLNTSSVGKTFTSSLVKQFTEDLSWTGAATTADKVGVAANWAGHIFTLASNVVDNVEEFKGQGNTGRMIAEIGIETMVDIGVGAVATAGVSAVAAFGVSALAAAGITVSAPALLIGAGAAGVTWAANGVCKWLTGGKDIGEVVSDVVCDTAEKVGEFVGNAAKKAKEGFSTVAKWGKSLLGFA